VRGVLTDWGGVLTSSIPETMRAWLEAEDIDRDCYRTLMTDWISQAYQADGQANPIHALERGECTIAEFERMLAARLVCTDGSVVAADGLLSRMFAAASLVEPMVALMRSLRERGTRTGLLSNAWGDDYPRQLFPELFDAVIISSEVGMRKPEERIFRYALGELGLRPEECVFIDDLEANIAAAEAIGLIGVHHVDARSTAAAVWQLVGKP
jgi:putative hydrolase of the HAD superfamily